MPVIVEATRFLFSEVSNWIDSVRARVDSPSTHPKPEDRPHFDLEQFYSLETDSVAMTHFLNEQQAKASAYVVQGVVEQIKIHRKNLVDHETTEAEYGSLTPQHIRHAIDRESRAIVDKTEQLRSLLEDVYGQSIVL